MASLTISHLCYLRSTNPKNDSKKEGYYSQQAPYCDNAWTSSDGLVQGACLRIVCMAKAAGRNVPHELKSHSRRLRFAVIMRSGNAKSRRLQPMALWARLSRVRRSFTSLEIIYGKRRAQQHWELTTDPETLLKNATCDTHSNLKYHKVGNLWFKKQVE